MIIGEIERQLESPEEEATREGVEGGRVSVGEGEGEGEREGEEEERAEETKLV